MKKTNLLSSDLLLPLDLGGSCPSLLARVNEASLDFNSGLATQTDGRSVVGTSFYLVPSFAAFLSLFNHLCVLVFCSYFFFFQQSVQYKLSETLFQSSDLWEKQFDPFKNRMRVWIYLIYILFSNPLRCPTSCELHITCLALFLLFTNP